MIDFKKTSYWSIYMDIFNLHKKFSEPVDAEEFWSALVTEADTVYKKYRAYPEVDFAKSLLLAVVAEIERSYKTASIHNGNTEKKR